MLSKKEDFEFEIFKVNFNIFVTREMKLRYILFQESEFEINHRVF